MTNNYSRKSFKKESDRITPHEEIQGIYRAIVENSTDPQKKGKVQIRIPLMHGVSTSKDSIEKADLPWAEPGTLGGTLDTANVDTPIVGSTVWVGFEGGDPSKPIYFGTVSTFASAAQTKLKRAVVSFKDVSGQLLRMVAEKLKEKVELFSVSKEKGHSSGVKLSTADAEVGYLVIAQDKTKNNKVYIEADATNASLSFVVVKAGSVVQRIDMADGVGKWSAKTSLTVESKGSVGVKASSISGIRVTTADGDGSVTANSAPSDPASSSVSWVDDKDKNELEED